MNHPDFEEFLDLLNAHKVRYLIVGAHALAFHARPRATKDLELWTEGEPTNQRQLIAAMTEFFGGTPPGYSVTDLHKPDLIIQLGVAPVRIDIMFTLPGVESFKAAYARGAEGRFGGIQCRFLSKDDLVSAKSVAGRPQDMADLAVLRRSDDS